ncbi:cupredoxin domain-containing protein [Candidatus Uhrbacteria bacterium]|nr:cupredoxin domain-containing protein [Candidatus Uhrbacteria bacterium]
MTKRLTFLSVTFTIVALATSFALSSLVPSAQATSLTSPEDLQPGDLIRGESFSAVYYYGLDGFRYVFPNDKTFFTWYGNFDDVVWLSDADMATIQIGGNVTYKPGVKMIKINSDPTVYVVGAGGEIMSIPSEGVAEDLYGSTWNKQIDDVPDGFFSNYTMGSALEMASQFDPDAEQAEADSIDTDKDLKAYVTITISDNAYSDESLTIDAGTAVRFVNEGNNKHTASAEDGSWGTGTLASGKHFTRYFDEAGDYDYYCKYHSSMTATITVE